jgi:NAD(P)-dependent dehydrogenase (short-subunit alcohol dehydrogenase family)
VPWPTAGTTWRFSIAPGSSRSTWPLGRLPFPDFLPYVASKATLVGIARSLSKPLGAHGITVNCVAFLASEAAAAVTGQTLIADGGSVLG